MNQIKCSSILDKRITITPLSSLLIGLRLFREIHPLDPQPHRHSMLVPTVCAPRVTRCSLGKYWSRDWFRGNFSLTQGLWNQQAANPGVHMLSMTHSGVRQRNLMTHAQCPLPVYYSQGYSNIMGIVDHPLLCYAISREQYRHQPVISRKVITQGKTDDLPKMMATFWHALSHVRTSAIKRGECELSMHVFHNVF